MTLVLRALWEASSLKVRDGGRDEEDKTSADGCGHRLTTQY